CWIVKVVIDQDPLWGTRDTVFAANAWCDASFIDEFGITIALSAPASACMSQTILVCPLMFHLHLLLPVCGPIFLLFLAMNMVLRCHGGFHMPLSALRVPFVLLLKETCGSKIWAAMPRLVRFQPWLGCPHVLMPYYILAI
ncbi:hypothetical protein Tco_1416679, partial [Tanacetum coccineum]